jgi:AcrR family transcriptional regulator
MSPRNYRLGKRVEAIEQTRVRIIAVTRDLLAQDGYPQPPVDEVARRADVARATVYYQFGSKRGLLEAVVDDIQRRAGQQQIVAAVELADPIDALRHTFELGCRFWAAEHLLIRKISGLAAVDPEIRQILAQVEKNRTPLIAGLAQRLAAAGRLAVGCSESRAVDVLWMLSSFEAFDHLFTGRRLPVEEVAQVLFDLAARSIVRTRRTRAT